MFFFCKFLPNSDDELWTTCIILNYELHLTILPNVCYAVLKVIIWGYMHMYSWPTALHGCWSSCRVVFFCRCAPLPPVHSTGSGQAKPPKPTPRPRAANTNGSHSENVNNRMYSFSMFPLDLLSFVQNFFPYRCLNNSSFILFFCSSE